MTSLSGGHSPPCTVTFITSSAAGSLACSRLSRKTGKGQNFLTSAFELKPRLATELKVVGGFFQKSSSVNNFLCKNEVEFLTSLIGQSSFAKALFILWTVF
jgi:hypothetical protein